MNDTIEVFVYRDRGEDVQCFEVLPGEPVVLENDPWFHGHLGWLIPEYSRPATLYVYTNDSVRDPGATDTAEWNGPAENGLPFGGGIPPDDDTPFNGEWWGRVMFYAEEGLMR